MAVTKLSNSGIKTGVLKYDSMLAGNAAFDPAATWLIERVSPANGTTLVTFSNIPQTYQHLQIRLLAKNTRTADSAWGSCRMRINGDSGANYTYHELSGDGSTAYASGGTANTFAFGPGVPGSGGSNTSNFATHIIDIHDYASTTKNKTVRWFGGVDQNTTTANRNVISLFSNLWLSTSAITSLTFSHGDGNWSVNTTFALYGYKGV